jgi:2-polyprenyl-3-methyl-5-hydroxy-6-metoxy-1,4-benzoquinol methylase
MKPETKSPAEKLGTDRHTSFGLNGLKPLEKIGVLLSHRAVARVIRRYQRPRLLDLGSGFACRLITYFAEELGPSTVVDIQLDSRLARDGRLTLVESTIENAWSQLPEASFDVITIINVLEHVWEPQETLNAAATRLKPGGTLVINVPTWFGKIAHETQAFRLGLSSPVEIDDHKRYFDKRDLWPLLVRAGFKPSRITQSYHKFRLNLFATAQNA